MKLFAISIVANNFFGVSSKVTTRQPLFVFSEFKASLFLASKEKYATSDPEISAEKIMSTNTTTESTIKILIDGASDNAKMAFSGIICSGSNSFYLNLKG
jgi:hypothetical protein